MSVAVVGNINSSIGDIKSSKQVGASENKQAFQKMFAEAQASQPEASGTPSSANATGTSGLAGDSVMASRSAAPTADQLLLQGRAALGVGEDPKATADLSRVTEQSIENPVANTTLSQSTETGALAPSRGEDQLHLQGRLTIQQNSDTKWAADGSNVAVQAADANLASDFDRSAITGGTDQQGNDSDAKTSIQQRSSDKLSADQSYAASLLNINFDGIGGSNVSTQSAVDSLYGGIWKASGTQNGSAAGSLSGTSIDYRA